MKYLGLIRAGIFRKKTRAFLTIGSLLIAFLLYGILQAVNHAFSAGVSLDTADRLVTNGRYSIIDMLPVSYVNDIRTDQNVEAVTHATWFGGTYQEPRNFFAKFPVDPVEYLAAYDEMIISDEARRAFQTSRTGVIVNDSLAEKYGWSVGDRIPIIADIWMPKDGNTWMFDLVGTYQWPADSTNGEAMLINYAYFDENRRGGQGLVGWLITTMKDPAQTSATSARIDKMFENSLNETKTGSENEFRLSFAKQVGNIGLIVSAILGAVFFTILLVTGNTMSQAVRERVPELAILKTLGFTDGRVLALVLVESLCLALLGGGLGLALAALLMPGIASGLSGIVPGMVLTSQAFAVGLGIIVLLGLAVGLFPALSAMRLNIVEALRGH